MDKFGRWVLQALALAGMVIFWHKTLEIEGWSNDWGWWLGAVAFTIAFEQLIRYDERTKK